MAKRKKSKRKKIENFFKNPFKKIKNKNKFFIFGITGVLLLILFLGASLVIFSSIVKSQLPPLEQFGERKISQSTKIYDRTGEVLLYEIFGDEKRTLVNFEDIPEKLKQATLAAENEGFYTQPAFDIKAIIRAFIANVREGEIVQGGSTITQQLVKNTLLSSEKTITRKVKEIILAIELDSKYSKDEIFSAYLNQIPYGSNAYGVEAASQTFFDKPVSDLSLSQLATLASLPQAPSYYSPWGDNVNFLINRRDRVLDKMFNLEYITEEERNQAKTEDVIQSFAPPSIGSIKAPHFSLMVRDYLIKKYGEEVALNGGLRVITTLDWEIQEIAEDVISKGATRNEELYGGRNASLVAQDPKTGQIMAIVGSRDYFDTEIDGNFNVATQGFRQPGSALKPFVYLEAFNKGFHPRSVVIDAPTEFVSGDPNCPPILTSFSRNNSNCFNPENFDGTFRGPVSLQESLSQSINVSSVKVLYLVGLDDVLKTLNNFGITTLNEKWRYGLSLVLGGGEVRLMELINAYSTLADDG
ncbi:MAG: transglycosylase domain-containing protein, partial [Candidatus Paceibacterota bacterium]